MSTALLETPEIAFERLYEAHVRDVYRYALAVLRNPADAEDITQTTFMNAFRALKSGQEPVKPRPWLLAIAHNSCLMRFAYNSRRPREVPLESAERIPVPDDERPNVQAVLDELGKLPFNQRSALAMRELAGRSYEEIAETLGVTVSAVETLLFRARRTLRGRRSALDTLGAVQLPVSLESFFGGGGAALSTGGAVLGGAALKVVAVVAAGVALGAAGYSAGVGSGGPGPQRSQAGPAQVYDAAAASPARDVRTAGLGVSPRGASSRFVSGPASQTQQTQGASGTQPSASDDGVASPTTLAGAQATTGAASTSTGLVAPATTLQTPSVETPTVQTPSLQTPTVQTSSLPVTVPVTLPPPPTLPTVTTPTLPHVP